MPTQSRREFLGCCAAAFVTRVMPTPAWSLAARSAHPAPRPGITGAKVLTKEQLTRAPELVPLFDAVRAIPQIVDGVRCHCGCAEAPGFYSLLSCFEDGGMAIACPVCQGEARLVAQLHAEGKTLDDIRRAIDTQFG